MLYVTTEESILPRALSEPTSDSFVNSLAKERRPKAYATFLQALVRQSDLTLGLLCVCRQRYARAALYPTTATRLCNKTGATFNSSLIKGLLVPQRQSIKSLQIHADCCSRHRGFKGIVADYIIAKPLTARTPDLAIPNDARVTFGP